MTAKPKYQTLLEAQIPKVSLPDAAGIVRVIAGEFQDRSGPAKTFTPINLWDVTLRAGGSAELPLPNGHTTAFLLLSGEVVVNGKDPAGEGDLARFTRDGDGIAVSAKDDARLFLMDGLPIAEPISGYGPFVMNSRAKIQEAIEAYRLGRMGEMSSD